MAAPNPKHIVAWQPQPGPQTLFVQCPAYEVGYGGALGGGKTDALLGDFASEIDQGSGYKGIFFRKHNKDMDDVIQRSIEIFGPVFGQRCFKGGNKLQWEFPNGAMLQFRPLERDSDVNKYIGQQYSTIMWDQLEQWDSPWPYTFLMTRNRSAKGIKAKIRCAFNPGGVGSEWVQARFIDPMVPGEALKVDTKTPGEFYYRVFIPAKLEDNQILMRNDPGYADRIYECSDPVLADALRQGLWDKIPNAAFSEFDKSIHVIDPYPIPHDRPVIRSMDWGFKTPYCCLWGFPTEDGEFIIANEMYGWSGVPNVGTEESPEAVRRKIEAFESAHEIFVPVGMLDNQCWKQDGSPDQIANQLGGTSLGWRPWPKGPGSRVNQKMGVHEFLKTINGKPRLKIMRNCRHLIRTLPKLPVAKNNRDDVDTDSEDHAYDALRAMLTRKIPTRDQIRRRAMRRRMAALEPESDNLPYGRF